MTHTTYGRQVLFNISIFFGVILIGAIIEWHFQFSKTYHAWQQMRQVQTEFATLQSHVKNATYYAQQLQTANASLSQARGLIPSQATFNQAIAQFIQRGKSLGLQFITWQPGEVSSTAFYSKVAIKMEIIGTYSQLIDFFLASKNTFPLVSWQNQWVVQRQLPPMTTLDNEVKSNLLMFQTNALFYYYH